MLFWMSNTLAFYKKLSVRCSSVFSHTCRVTFISNSHIQVHIMTHKNTSDSRTLIKDSRKQAQLRKPFMERQLRFTKEGYTMLKQLQAENEDKLQRRMSESVLLDILLTQQLEKYSI